MRLISVSAPVLWLAVLVQGGAAVNVPQLAAPEWPSAAVVALDVPFAGPFGSLRDEAGRATALGQIVDEARSAEASPALSTPRQGRLLETPPIGGRDRCANADGSVPDTPACRRRIEARAGDYSKPTAAPVTAEGRLLVLTQPQSPLKTGGAAGRLGANQDLDALAGSAAGELAAIIAQSKPGQTSSQGGSSAGAAAGQPNSPGGVAVVTPR